MKRSEVYQSVKRAKSVAKRERRRRNKRQRTDSAGGGGDAAAAKTPRTLESTREVDDTFVAADDVEVAADEADDEFAHFFNGTLTPKLMVTTRIRPSKGVYPLLAELLRMVPNAYYYKRGTYELKKISRYAASKGFTHLVVVNEKRKRPNQCVHSLHCLRRTRQLAPSLSL